MDVSIIIVNYNTCTLTKNCIDSIFTKTTGVKFEVIVVDNASTDDSVRTLKKDPRILLIESGSNLGFGKANNLGYRRASGKYIFLLNSDTLLLNNAVELFYNAHEQMPPDVACLGTILKAQDGFTDNHSYEEFPSIKNTFYFLLRTYFRIKSKTKPLPSLPFVVDYITGADLFIRKAVIERMGLFSPDFFMYYEETEMQFRYALAGYKSMIISGPRIIHFEGASAHEGKTMSCHRKYIYFSSMFIFMRKRYSSIKYIIFRIIAVLFLPILLRNCSIREKIILLKLFL